jgi:hypothetical protein
MTPNKEGFKITDGKGFHMTFENGYTVSVQWGGGNYCDNYDEEIGGDRNAVGKKGCRDAEVAVWGQDGDLIDHPDFGGDTVGARFTVARVLELMIWAASQSQSGAKHD